MAVYVTGDTHGGTGGDDWALRRWAERTADKLTKDDYLIIAGDCGLLWEVEVANDFRRFLADLPFTVLFIDGNQDDHWALALLSTVQKFGADVGHVERDVYHLRRGRIYTIGDKTWFCFGGGISIDKAMRKEGISWWPEEIPSKEEFQLGMRNLIDHDMQVDVVLTHTAPRSVLLDASFAVHSAKVNDPTAFMLDAYKEAGLKCDRWFCGHFHRDVQLGDVRILMNQVVEV